VKSDATENIEESNQYGTNLLIVANEGTLEETNEPIYTELNESTVYRNMGDATRSFGTYEEPICFELDDPRCLNELVANDANQSQEFAYAEMSPILYTDLKSSFANLEQSVDNHIERQTNKHVLHYTDAGLVQSDENRQDGKLHVVQLYADVAGCTFEQNSKDSSVHQGMDQFYQSTEKNS
jgi:hypothetical protein